MSAKNRGVQTPPRPVVSRKSEIGIPPLPLVRQNQKLANPPSPLSEIQYCCTLINLVKPTFEKEISNFEINQTCVKHNKKEHLRQNIG